MKLTVHYHAELPRLDQESDRLTSAVQPNQRGAGLPDETVEGDSLTIDESEVRIGILDAGELVLDLRADVVAYIEDENDEVRWGTHPDD